MIRVADVRVEPRKQVDGSDHIILPEQQPLELVHQQVLGGDVLGIRHQVVHGHQIPDPHVDIV